MSRFKLIATNFLTAVLTAAVTSAFWIAAYNSARRKEAPQPPAPRAEAPAGAGEVAIGPSGLAVPVAGMKPDQLTDTFTQARAGGKRVHDAIDIMAPEGTPVVAAASGRVEKLFFSKGGGGITAYIRSPNGEWSYYYAHLRNYAPGLAEGRAVQRGNLIGHVGHTGNASVEGPHLHFAVHRMKKGEAWHGGEAVNPYPLLAGGR